MFGVTLIVYWWLLLAGVIFNALLGLYQVKHILRRKRKWDMQSLLEQWKLYF